jgi:hypothetical protein
MTEGPAHLETLAGVVSSPTAAAEAKLARAGEAVLTEVVAPPPVVGEVVAGEVTATDAPSAPLGHEDTREVTVKTMGETSARVEASKPPEPAAPSIQTIMSTSGTWIGAATGPPLFGAASDSGRAPQGILTARAAGSERDEAPPAPDAATKGASGERSLLPQPGLALGV